MKMDYSRQWGGGVLIGHAAVRLFRLLSFQGMNPCQDLYRGETIRHKINMNRFHFIPNIRFTLVS